MAKIEDLIKNIPNSDLRDEIAREVAKLKAGKKFGLVFEEHIPELAQLPGLPVKAGARVVKRGGKSNAIYTVLNALPSPGGRGAGSEGKNFKIRLEPDGPEETASANELIVVKRFGEPIYPALTPVDHITRAPGQPYHTLINADNYHALQLLLYCYAGQVDVIYIDPPYNTGARDWKYSNDYVDSTDQWRHSKWLAMMKRRLLLAKRLLKPAGVIAIAIDDNEYHHLRCLADSIFGENNHLGTVCVRHKPGGTVAAKKFARSHEYCVFYGRGPSATIGQLARTEEQWARFKYSDAQGVFEWENFRKHGQACLRVDRPKQYYSIWAEAKTGKVKVPSMKWDDKVKSWRVTEPEPSSKTWRIVLPHKGKEQRVWLWSPEKVRRNLDEFEYRNVDGEELIYKKRRPLKQGVVPTTTWTEPKYSANEHGTGMLIKVLGTAELFDFPKSVFTVEDCLSVISGPNALIVDFFAGSGTTLQATCLLNAEDGGQRRCILVTNNEVNEKEAKQLNEAGHWPGQVEFEKHGICESVTWPRCKYVINGQRDDGTQLPGVYLNGREMKEGFEANLDYFKLDFLDPHAVAKGQAFESILPILWLMAGAVGQRETSRGGGKWFIPKHSPYAVLIDEHAIRAFARELRQRPDVTHVFLVTDSEEAYHALRAKLPGSPQTRMLYKSYLENFKINADRLG